MCLIPDLLCSLCVPFLFSPVPFFKMFAPKLCAPDVMTTVVWNKLYRSNILSDVMFPARKIYEDQYFTAKVLLRAEKVIMTNKKMYYYRVNSSSITGAKYNIRFLDALDMHDKLLREVLQNKNTEKRIIEAKIVPYAISQYSTARYFDQPDAMNKAYRYVLKYYIRYLLSKNVEVTNKFAVTLFIFNPTLALQYCHI